MQASNWRKKLDAVAAARLEALEGYDRNFPDI